VIANCSRCIVTSLIDDVETSGAIRRLDLRVGGAAGAGDDGMAVDAEAETVCGDLRRDGLVDVDLS
jgi:hypothetical protein